MSPVRKIDLLEHFKNEYLMVIEDMTSMRRTIRSMLKQIGIGNVQEADDGDTALQILAGQPNCSFMLVDWNMPRMPGIDLVRELRSKAEIQDIPLLMVTAEMGRDEVAQAAEAGVNGYIVKPFVARTLEEKIVNTLVARANPPDHVKLVKAGEELIRIGDHQKALAVFQKADEMRSSARIQVNIGETYELIGHNDNAHMSYNKAIGMNPLYLKAHLRSAGLHFKQGNHAAALEAFKRAGEISPNNIDRQIAIGKLLAQLGDSAQAITTLTQAIKREPERAAAVAEELLNMGKADLAEHFFRESLNRLGDSVHIFNRIGIALRRQGKWREAIREYESAIKIDPRDAVLYFNVGKAYMEGKQLREANHYMRKALELNPGFQEAKVELESLGKAALLWD